MSLPPPSSSESGSGSGLREYVLELETPKAWGRRKGAVDVLRLSAMGASITFENSLHQPLRLPLGMLQLGLVDPGGARPDGLAGRFPILKRLSATAVIPREQGIEGWLWTSQGGTGLTVLGDPEDAPNAALLLTTPLGEDVIAAAFAPDAAADIAAHSPLGAPAVQGLLFRVTDPVMAENAFRSYGILRPLTDREVPPTLRRSLPGDRAADPTLRGTGDPRAVTSVAPPGMG
jgi:hypothetical protein